MIKQTTHYEEREYRRLWRANGGSFKLIKNDFGFRYVEVRLRDRYLYLVPLKEGFTSVLNIVVKTGLNMLEIFG